jgi:IS5 family transposase
MSFSYDGLVTSVRSQTIPIFISKENPLLKLSAVIQWKDLTELVLPDLKNTTRKGYWWMGRSLNLRVHLSVMILQVLFKLTDRRTEELVKQMPLYMAFCGHGQMKKWRCPDHTKIEEFRNRLSPETHKKICDYILKQAVKLNLAKPSILDIDSTVQEANMAYPSDSSLMKKLALKCAKTLDYMKEKGKRYLPKEISIDIKSIIKKSREYFFLAKNTAIDKKRLVFSELHSLVKKELKGFIRFAESLSNQAIRNLPWNHQLNIKQIREDAWRYILDVAHFTRKHTIKEGKILSFNMKDVVCVIKKKMGKDKEFGRVFQVGRIAGNFLVPYTCTSLEMNDKSSLKDLLTEHENIFGEGVLESVTADKGYYSRKNVRALKEVIGCADGLQRPWNAKDQVVGPQKEELYNRRSGVEPVIGHAKKFGLGKSKMKTDRATLASGYRSILGFNLHQILRNFGEKENLRLASVSKIGS